MLPQDSNAPQTGLGPIGTGPIPSSPPVSDGPNPSFGPSGSNTSSGWNGGGENGANNGREGFVIAVGVLLGAVLVLGGLFGFQRWRSGVDESAIESIQAEESTGNPGNGSVENGNEAAEEADQDREVDEEEPSNDQSDGGQLTEDPDGDGDAESTDRSQDNLTPTECPAGISSEICNAVRFVEEETGRPFKNFPVVELLENDAFDAEILKDFAQYEEDFNEDEVPLKAMGLLGSDISLYQTYLSLIELGVVGFYRPDTDQLVVRGGELDLYGQSVLVHELVHAHDDQWYDLDREDFENDDAEAGFAAVVEGNASRIENAWIASLSPEQAAEVDLGALAALSPDDFTKLLALPPVMIQLQSFPYQDGEVYVAYRTDAEGESVIAELYENPPESTEQILHPAEEFQPTIDVGLPPADGEVAFSGTLGELYLSLWFDQVAAAGWGGDSFVTWSAGATTCMRVDIAADTAEDLNQIEASAQRWQGSAPSEDRTIERVDTADQSLVRITSCY